MALTRISLTATAAQIPGLGQHGFQLKSICPDSPSFVTGKKQASPKVTPAYPRICIQDKSPFGKPTLYSDCRAFRANSINLNIKSSPSSCYLIDRKDDSLSKSQVMKLHNPP